MTTKQEAWLIEAGFKREEVCAPISVWQTSPKAKYHFKADCVKGATKSTASYASIDRGKMCSLCSAPRKVTTWYHTAKQYADLYHLVKSGSNERVVQRLERELPNNLAVLLTENQVMGMWLQVLRFKIQTRLDLGVFAEPGVFTAWEHNHLLPVVQQQLDALGADANVLAPDQVHHLAAVIEATKHIVENPSDDTQLVATVPTVVQAVASAYYQGMLAGSSSADIKNACSTAALATAQRIHGPVPLLLRLDSTLLEKHHQQGVSIVDAMKNLWLELLDSQVQTMADTLAGYTAPHREDEGWFIVEYPIGRNLDPTVALVMPYVVDASNNKLVLAVPKGDIFDRLKTVIGRGVGTTLGVADFEPTSEDYKLASKIVGSDLHKKLSEALVLAKASRI